MFKLFHTKPLGMVAFELYTKVITEALISTILISFSNFVYVLADEFRVAQGIDFTL